MRGKNMKKNACERWHRDGTEKPIRQPRRRSGQGRIVRKRTSIAQQRRKRIKARRTRHRNACRPARIRGNAFSTFGSRRVRWRLQRGRQSVYSQPEWPIGGDPSPLRRQGFSGLIGLWTWRVFAFVRQFRHRPNLLRLGQPSMSSGRAGQPAGYFANGLAVWLPSMTGLAL